METCCNRLIFIISQPRSGSTLLQHVLGSHSEIYTVPEPWLMLHLIYGLRPSGLTAEYNARYAYLALKGFLERINTNEAFYFDAIRSTAKSLYEKALSSSGKRYFLDKTPRYYFIIPELYQIFPRAKFIFLLRNPLAVLSSILEVNLNGDFMSLFSADRRHDILTAPRLILEGIDHLGRQATAVNYEQLVAEPEQEIKKLCQHLGLKFEIEMLNYRDRVRFSGTTFVDPKSIYRHREPVGDYIDQWEHRFDTPQKIHIAKSYLSTLGQDVLENLGYAYEDLMIKLDSLKSSKKQILIPWNLLATPTEELSWQNHLKLAFFRSLENRGTWGTFRRFVSFMLKGR